MIELQEKIKAVLSSIQVDFGGGCSVEKALVMAELIKHKGLKTSLDIGVYRGRSLFPQAVAHHNFSKGVVYGVDPYSKQEAKQFDRPDLQPDLDAFAQSTDFEAIFQEVTRLIIKNNLQQNCILIKKRSDEAVEYFKQAGILFDLIHIDGNHDTQMVMQDVHLYSPLLNHHGFIVLDDISWSSVAPAFKHLSSHMKKVVELKDTNNDFAVFWQGSSLLELFKYKLLLKSVIAKRK